MKLVFKRKPQDLIRHLKKSIRYSELDENRVVSQAWLEVM